MKKIIPIMMIAAAPLSAFAQGAGVKACNLNKTVNPAEDFYQFSTGGWQKLNPLPAAFSRYGSFDQLDEDNNKRINAILSDMLKKTYKAGTTEQKLGDFYKLAMDSARRNAEGTAPVQPILKQIEAAKTLDALHAIQKQYADFGYGLAFSYGLGADEKNAKENILQVSQSGLTLGLKEYYLDNDEATAKIREQYKQHIVNMFKLFGFSESDATAKRDLIVRFETMVALISKSRTELRDVEANYNKTTLVEFQKNYPNLPLEAQANAEGIKSEYMKELVVGQPDFLKGLDKLVATQSADELRALMEWSVIRGAAGYLSDEVRAEQFDFFSHKMRGVKEDYPRWKRATQQVEGQMGEALGKIYCERYFPASSKARMQTLVKNLQVAPGERIKAQDWMSDSTKQNALEKLATFYVKIGYPDKWKDMSGLNIDPTKTYYENVMAARKFWNQDQIARTAGKPVDKDEWFMTPQTVNAYYNPTTNEICFPAGILQYPFFDPKADDAFNYGAIGVVIGHEMTHGFDDQGCHYDKDGNMHDWWTASDRQNFEERTGKYADFFSNIKVLPDLNGNGRLTLGENLADHGGLQVAWYAYKNATAGKKQKNLLGYTADQRFFLAYAGVWAANITDEEIRSRTKSDPHALGRWRVNGALPHIDMWYEAFGVKSTDKMFVPVEERLKLW